MGDSAEQLTQLLSRFVEQQSQLLSRFTQQAPTVSQTQHEGNVTSNIVSQNLNFESFDDSKEEFKHYRQRLENFFELKQISGSDPALNKLKARILINCIGSKHYQLLVSLVSPESPIDKNYSELIALIENHLCPKPNIHIEQHKFLSRTQSPNESVAEFIADIRKLTAACEFTCPFPQCGKSIASVFLRAQFIRGIADPTTRERLLQEKELSFERAAEIALAMEATKIGNKVMSNVPEPAVNKVGVSHLPRQQSARNATQYKTTSSDIQTRSRVNYAELGIAGLCLRCGLQNHTTPECRRDRQTLKCSLCSKIGHISKVCIITLSKKKRSNVNNIYPQVSNHTSDEYAQIPEESTESPNNMYHINKILEIKTASTLNADNKIFVSLQVGHGLLKFEADTGSPVTIISKTDFNKACPNIVINNSDVKFRTFTGECFTPLGVAKVPVQYCGRTSEEELYVVSMNTSPLLGRDWLRRLNMNVHDFDYQQIRSIKKIDSARISQLRSKFLNDYADVFQEKVGAIPNYTCSLKLKDKNIKPIFVKHRRIPHALINSVNEELDKLESDGIIEKIEHSDWGSPLVVVPKPHNKVRLCVDYKVTINRHLQDARTPIPLIEDVLNNLRGGKVYCLLDIHKAYLHMEVDEESQMLQAISTHRGTFKMKRLSFGVKTAPSEFNKLIYMVLQGLDGVESYFDDIAIMGSSVEECANRLKACLDRMRHYKLHINKDKSTFFSTEIQYLGHIVNANGIKKSPEKVEALLKAPRPKNIDDVRSFVGCVTYYGKFIHNVSAIMSPIYALLKNKESFNWDSKCELAFKTIKQALASDTVLVRYDPKLPLILATDASPVGLSAVLSHIINGVERPIFFASRTLSNSEKNYSQLDKEATAIYWGVQKFFPYVYGRKFNLVTDNKPLYYILNPDKNLPVVTASRLLRYSMFLRGFNYEIHCKSSKDNANADYFSRSPVPDSRTMVDEDFEIFNLTVSQVSSDIISHKKIHDETNSDLYLSQLKNSLLDGTSMETEFSLHEGIIFRGERVYIPKSLQPQILKELHMTHQGVVRMKSLARRYCYWPHIDKDIECLAKSCRACADVQSDPGKVPAHVWEPPRQCWERIHIDYAGPFMGCYFLIIIDALSKWPEVLITKSAPTSESTISMLRSVFSHWGLPNIMVSDNASIFTSETFKGFCDRNGIIQKTIAPGHPATNGQAERFVRTLKLRLKAAANEPGTLMDKLNTIIFYYRATPFPSTDKSPSEMFIGRKLRTKLDIIKPQPLAEITNNFLGPNGLLVRQLHLGERVQARNYSSSQLWKYGTVVDILGKLHYLIELDAGYVVRRHINQLKSTEASSNLADHKQVEFRSHDMDSQLPPPKPKIDSSISLTTEVIQHTKEGPCRKISEEINNSVTSTSVLNSPQISTNPVSEEVRGPAPQTPRDSSAAHLRRSQRIKKPVIRLNL